MPSPAGGSNTFLPSLTGNLIVSFSRDPKKFLVNELAKITPVDKDNGYFPKIRIAEQARILDADLRRWYDGGPRPISDFNSTQFEFVPYRTTRFAEPAMPIGKLALDQADFPILEATSQQIANRAMLFRAKQFYTLLQTSGTYLASHQATATALGGGLWGAATTANRYIQKSLQAAARQIELTTLGAVRYTDLTLVLSPTVAQAIASSAEYAEGYIQSQFAKDQTEGSKWNAAYGLGETLYGMRVFVDPTCEVTSNLNAAGTATGAYVPGANEAYIIARAGDLVNNTGVATDFSSVHFFVYKDEEMKTEVLTDDFNKRTLLSVMDNFVAQAVANETMYRITAVLS